METDFSNWTIILFHKLDKWWVELIDNLPNIALATIVMVCFIFLARFVRSFTGRVMPRVLHRHTVNSLISNVAYLIVVLFGLFVTLNILNLNQAVSSLLAGAGIIGLVLGFAFQDISANFISGIYIAFKRPFEIGQSIDTNGYSGTIEDIELRTTTIRTYQGVHLLIPNKEIFQKPILNYSRGTDRRIELTFSLAPQFDLKKVLTLCKQAIEKLDYIEKAKPVEVYFTGFADNVVKMAVWFWIYNDKPPGFMVAQNDAIVNIVEALYTNNISLVVTPFPPAEPAADKDDNKEGKEKILESHQNGKEY
ncbi:MAG TPA: mechanosensitive ion channel family protein [Cytophagaceae bacterium]|nr:mechanosensitive ion channel family protein [Cytophagaceae bacterium]